MVALTLYPADENLAGDIHVNPIVGGFLYFVGVMGLVIFLAALAKAISVKDE